MTEKSIREKRKSLAEKQSISGKTISGKMNILKPASQKTFSANDSTTSSTTNNPNKLTLNDLSTPAVNTWCPGCTNFGILQAFKKAIVELHNEGKIDYRKVVILSGIGCHGKIVDYIKLSSYYTLHGRVLPSAIGIKLANPSLHVVGFAGDGDAYCEGIEHFVHACNYDADLTYIVHDNQIFALTTGQPTATTEKGLKTKSTPKGKPSRALNPIALALVSGASFVARGFALDVDHLKNLIKQAILHKGFAFIDVLQPCISFHNTTDYLRKHIYKLESVDHDPTDFDAAMKRAREWRYEADPKGRVAVGVFFKKEE